MRTESLFATSEPTQPAGRADRGDLLYLRLAWTDGGVVGSVGRGRAGRVRDFTGWLVAGTTRTRGGGNRRAIR